MRQAVLRAHLAGLGLALAVLGAAPSIARAQGLEIKGGLSYGSVPNNNGILPGNLSPHTGFVVGLGVSSGGVVGLAADLLYAQRGYTSSVVGNSQKLSYLDLPVMLRVALPSPGITPFAVVGPQVSFELNCDSDGGSCPSGRNDFTYAGVIGAGAKFGMLGGLSIEARYVYGLSDLKYSTVSNGNSYQSRSFLFMLGLGF
jgi:hypothetical protein